MRHCSCTVKNGIYSLFASSHKDVTTQCVIEKSFKRRKYNTVSVGELVIVRDKLKNMPTNRNYHANNADIDPEQLMYRQAIVLRRFVDEDKQTFIAVKFVAALHKLGIQIFSINDVCRNDFVKDCII